jgi:hypothetical protein
MANASPDPTLVQNVGILNQRMADVAKRIAAGDMTDAAKSLQAIADAAIWISASLTGEKTSLLPPVMLPGGSCRPLVPPPTKPYSK